MSDTAPRITVKPSLKQLDNGNKLEFHCEIEANPKPEIKWFKENVQISDSDRIKTRMEPKGANLYNIYLEIDNLTSDDSGQFKVNAKNRLGEVSAAIALNFAGNCKNRNFLFVFFLINYLFIKLRLLKRAFKMVLRQILRKSQQLSQTLMANDYALSVKSKPILSQRYSGLETTCQSPIRVAT